MVRWLKLSGLKVRSFLADAIGACPVNIGDLVLFIVEFRNFMGSFLLADRLAFGWGAIFK